MAYNRLLTEFEGSLAHRLFASRHWWIKLSIAVWVGTLLVLVLGDRARVNALGLEITAAAPVLNPPVRVAHICGYLTELPHALLYLVLAPGLFFLAERFVNQADEGLNELWKRGALIATDGNSFPLDRVASLGKQRACRILPWLLVIVCISLLNVWNETRSYNVTKDNPMNHDLGYVQAPFLDRWDVIFSSLPASNQWQWIQNLNLSSQLSEHLKGRLEDSGDGELLDVWLKYIRPKSGSLVTRGNVKQILTAGKYDLDLHSAVIDGSLTLSAKTSGGPKTPQEKQFWVGFLAALFLVEGVFQAFTIWLVIKILVWIMILYRMLSSAGFHGLKIKPVFLDPQKRYGLRELHTVYNAIMWLLLVGAIIISFSYLSNSVKGTYFLTPKGFWAYSSQLLIIMAVAAAALAIVLGPVLLFARQLQQESLLFLADLAESEKNATSDEERAKCVQQRNLVEAQTTWPCQDWGFRGVVGSTIIFFTIPFLDSLHCIPPKYGEYVNSLKYCQRTMIGISRWRYKIPED